MEMLNEQRPSHGISSSSHRLRKIKIPQPESTSAWWTRCLHRRVRLFVFSKEVRVSPSFQYRLPKRSQTLQTSLNPFRKPQAGEMLKTLPNQPSSAVIRSLPLPLQFLSTITKKPSISYHLINIECNRPEINNNVFFLIYENKT